MCRSDAVRQLSVKAVLVVQLRLEAIIGHWNVSSTESTDRPLISNTQMTTVVEERHQVPA